MRAFLFFLLCAVAGAVAAQAAAPPAKTDAPAPTKNENPSASDPRVCLEFPTRQQVIACAERYRPHRPVAKS